MHPHVAQALWRSRRGVFMVAHNVGNTGHYKPVIQRNMRHSVHLLSLPLPLSLSFSLNTHTRTLTLIMYRRSRGLYLWGIIKPYLATPEDERHWPLLIPSLNSAEVPPTDN